MWFNIVFSTSMLRLQHWGVRSNVGPYGVGIYLYEGKDMSTCDWCFSANDQLADHHSITIFKLCHDILLER